jgi:hypothetical protein
MLAYIINIYLLCNTTMHDDDYYTIYYYVSSKSIPHRDLKRAADCLLFKPIYLLVVCCVYLAAQLLAGCLLLLVAFGCGGKIGAYLEYVYNFTSY